MKTTIRAQQMRVPTTFYPAAEKKLSKLDRFFPDEHVGTASADVAVHRKRPDEIVEIRGGSARVDKDVMSLLPGGFHGADDPVGNDGRGRGIFLIEDGVVNIQKKYVRRHFNNPSRNTATPSSAAEGRICFA